MGRILGGAFSHLLCVNRKIRQGKNVCRFTVLVLKIEKGFEKRDLKRERLEDLAEEACGKGLGLYL